MPHAIPPTVLITGARAPVALHLARLFHDAGWRVVLADTPARPLAAASKACDRYVRLPAPRFEFSAYADAVTQLVEDERPALVIPTCEEVFYLAMVWQQRRLAAPLFAPSIKLLREVHHKFEFIQLCERLGLDAPQSHLLENSDNLAAVFENSQNFVFKPAWSRFASRVLIGPTQAQLSAITPTKTAPWVAQELLRGEEISAYAFAREGQLLGHSLYRSPCRAGKGAGIYFEPVEDAQAIAFIEQFVKGTDWTGQISFDLMRLADGRVLPLECNPRATSGLHFFRDAAPFVRSMAEGQGVVERDVTRPQTVPLAMAAYGFPQALKEKKLGQFFKDLTRADNLFSWPNDRSLGLAQLHMLAELAGLAVRHRISLQQASTRDIEWDGPDQSSM